MCVSIITLVTETVHFSKSSWMEKISNRDVTWCQFVGFISFVKPLTKVTPSSGIIILLDFYPLICITRDVDYIVFDSQHYTIVISVDITYKFTSGMMPHI